MLLYTTIYYIIQLSSFTRGKMNVEHHISSHGKDRSCENAAFPVSSFRAKRDIFFVCCQEKDGNLGNRYGTCRQPCLLWNFTTDWRHARHTAKSGEPSGWPLLRLWFLIGSFLFLMFQQQSVKLFHLSEYWDMGHGRYHSHRSVELRKIEFGRHHGHQTWHFEGCRTGQNRRMDPRHLSIRLSSCPPLLRLGLWHSSF